MLRALELKKKLLVTEGSMGLCEDWSEDLKQYFHSLPDDLVENLGLKRNLNCFREIETMTIPDSWMETPADELHKFSFSFPG